VRLHLLAAEAQVPFDALRGALAVQWLDLGPPFDGPASLWVGASNPDFAALEAPPARLSELAQSLLDLLSSQQAVDVLPPEDVLASGHTPAFAAVAISEETRSVLSRIAWMTMCGWSRWLPGLSGASVPFLSARALRRAARVRVADGLIEVELDPAPLDVVIEMAGYFRPIEVIPWLDGRTVTFAVRRRPGA
jgi:hypothetical protein